jgi:hypothetical protein
MKTMKRLAQRLGGRALPESSVLWSTRHGLFWTLGAFATMGLIGMTLVSSYWNKGPLVRATMAGANRIVLTANAAPPVLWSNAWLGRRPYRAVPFHGLRRVATGFSLVAFQKPKTLTQDLLRVAPDISARLTKLKDEFSAEATRAFAAHAWL